MALDNSTKKNLRKFWQKAVLPVKQKVDFLTPATQGSDGEVLTMLNNQTVWRTPGVGNIEVVTLTISVEGGEASVSGVSISVWVEGEASVRALATDAEGKCTFSVNRGLNYSISFGQISGFVKPDDISNKAVLATRNISATYNVAKEVVVMTLVYDLTGSARAESVNVTIAGTTTTHELTDNVCRFYVPVGTAYTISFNDVSGYVRPASKSFTAASTSIRNVKAYYVGAAAGLSWIKNDGTVIGFYDVVSTDEPDLLGLRVATSSLVSANSTFVIPLAYLLAESSIGNKTYGASVLLESIGTYANETAALTDDGTNYDGEANTLAVLEEATRRILSMPAFTACHAVTYNVGGETRACFLGSYAQMKAIGRNREIINSICNSAFGKSCVAINSGGWWTSTQNSAQNGVRLNDGGFYSRTKGTNYQVLPLLAY